MEKPRVSVTTEQKYLLRNSTNVVEALAKNDKHSTGTTTQSRRGAIKSRVPGSEHDHITVQCGQCRFAFTHSYKTHVKAT